MRFYPSVIRLITGASITIALLLFIGAYSFIYFSKSHDAEKWVSHTREVLTNLESIHGHIYGMETNQRGYIISNDKSYLLDLEKTEKDLALELKSFRLKIPDNMVQRANLIILEKFIQKRKKTLHHVIDVFNKDYKAGISIIKTGVSIKQMKLIRGQIDKMRELEVNLLTARLEEADHQSENAGNLILVFTSFAIICLLGFVLINYRDLKRRFRIEENLKIAEKIALDSNRSKSDFLANMSHEIRTPMNAIMGMADLLMDTPLSAEQRRYVKIFKRSGEGLLNLINDILDISKIESSQLELDNVDFPIADVIEQVIELVSIKAHQKGIELNVFIDPDVTEYFTGDPDRLRQIILNLVNNAIKFTEFGEVSISIKSHPKDKLPNHFLIEVKDTGIGMTTEQSAKVFERFTQADKGISHKFGGTGLGLSIAKKFTELMKGTISIQSEINVGSVFTIDLKLPIAEKTQSNFNLVPDLNIEGKKVLVVDDNSSNRLILSKILKKYKVNLYESESGAETLRMVKAAINDNDPYDLIILDGHMPDMNGFAVAEEFQKDGLSPETLLVMLTSDQRVGDLEKTKSLGISGYLVKPVSLREFTTKLSSILNPTNDAKTNAYEATSISNQISILVVDDNQDNRNLLDAYLKDEKYKLTMATNGQEAVNFFKEVNFDLVLMDIQMPVLDGLEATKQIRLYEEENNKAPTPIIALSAHALKEEKEKSISAGCNLHLTKPIKKTDLLLGINSYLINATTMTQHTATIDPDIEAIAISYFSNRKQELPILKEYLKQRDFKNINILGHKMRGVAESYGFPELTVLGDTLEQAAKTESDEVINETIKKIEYYLANVQIKIGTRE